jgi:hypothetical protein
MRVRLGLIRGLCGGWGVTWRGGVTLIEVRLVGVWMRRR